MDCFDLCALTFHEDYEPESFQGKSIDMVVTKSPFDE